MSKKIKILTPDNVEVEYSLASAGTRAAAAGIDLLIQSVVFLIIGGICALVLYIDNADTDMIYLVAAILFAVFALLNYGYFIVSDMVMKGRTIGKKIYHLRIIRDNGEGLTITHAMIREFFRAIIDPIGIGFILIFFSKKNKRIGDMLASTIVVEENKSELTYMDLTNYSISQYELTKEEINLLKDYFGSKDSLNTNSLVSLQNKLVAYFKNKFIVDDDIKNVDEFLKSLLQ